MKHSGFIAAILRLLRPEAASPEPPIDGGVRHWVNTDAPKVIQSGEIAEFFCQFSTTDRCLTDTPIAGGIFTLRAGKEQGHLQIHGRQEIAGEWHFRPKESFFRQLQEIVSRYDFAQYNGQFYTVSGLPPGYGMKLEIRYASGESIRASNNQSTFLPLEAMQDLAALFENQIRKSGGM